MATEPGGVAGKVDYMTGISLGDGTFRWGFSNLRDYATPGAVATGDVNGS